MVRIRLSRLGKHKRPFYRIVVAESHFPRDGRFLEVLGTYDPLAKEGGLNFNTERMNEWVQKGAQASPVVKDLARKVAREAVRVAAS